LLPAGGSAREGYADLPALAVLRSATLHFTQPAQQPPKPLENSTGPEALVESLESIFGRSLHIRFVDAGACGACVSEARQLNNPYYNMHRLGFFMTPTPRNADVLMVSGPVSDAMRIPLSTKSLRDSSLLRGR
jgi:hypothetical protein